MRARDHPTAGSCLHSTFSRTLHLEAICTSACGYTAHGMQAANDNCQEQVPGQPMYIALVDLTCGADFLELVKSGLLAALEAVPPSALFALITFSTKVSLQHALF